jgi:hypothetical protein
MEKMKNTLIKTCLTGIVLSVAGIANADQSALLGTIFTPQLTSHSAISGAAVSIAADSVVDGNLAAQAAVTIGAGYAEAQDIYAGAAVTVGASSTVKNIYAGAAATIGAGAVAQDIYAGAAITLGVSASVQEINAGAAITYGVGATASETASVPTSNAAGDIHKSADMAAALAQIASARQALALLSPVAIENAYPIYPLQTTYVGHLSLDPGVHYGSALNLAANSIVTFEPTADESDDQNEPHHVYIINLSEALTVGANTTFRLGEGVTEDTATIIWNVDAAVTLGAGTDFIGSAFVGGAFNAATSDISCGNIYATGAVSVGSILGCDTVVADIPPASCPIPEEAISALDAQVAASGLFELFPGNGTRQLLVREQLGITLRFAEGQGATIAGELPFFNPIDLTSEQVEECIVLLSSYVSAQT